MRSTIGGPESVRPHLEPLSKPDAEGNQDASDSGGEEPVHGPCEEEPEDMVRENKLGRKTVLWNRKLKSSSLSSDCAPLFLSHRTSKQAS